MGKGRNEKWKNKNNKIRDRKWRLKIKINEWENNRLTHRAPTCCTLIYGSKDNFKCFSSVGSAVEVYFSLPWTRTIRKTKGAWTLGISKKKKTKQKHKTKRRRNEQLCIAAVKWTNSSKCEMNFVVSSMFFYFFVWIKYKRRVRIRGNFPWQK